MKEIYEKIEAMKNIISSIEDEKYKEVFNSFGEIIMELSDKVNEVNRRQEYLEENIEYIGDDLTDIQEELFEEVSFDDLADIEEEYIEINCKKCSKPLFVEKQAIDSNDNIPCPFCGESAR